MKCVSTGSYIVYSYLDLCASRLKVTKTESTLLGMLFNISQIKKTSFALKRYANINIDRNELRGNGDLSSTVSSRTISIAVFNINTVTDISGIFSVLHFWKRCGVSAIRKQA